MKKGGEEIHLKPQIPLFAGVGGGGIQLKLKEEEKKERRGGGREIELKQQSWALSLTPVIPALCEAEEGGSPEVKKQAKPHLY